MWLHLFFGQHVFSLCYISGEVHNPVSLWSFEPVLFAGNREEKWIGTSQSLLETARTFPWESTCFHSPLFIADFLKDQSSPAGARLTKELSRWDTTWENLLVNVEQRQQEVEVSGGAERRFFWDPLSEISSHLFSCCQGAMAPERCSPDLFWRRSPAEICLPSALLKECSCSLILLITSSLNHTKSGFTFWLYLFSCLVQSSGRKSKSVGFWGRLTQNCFPILHHCNDDVVLTFSRVIYQQLQAGARPWDTGVMVHLPPEEAQFITCTSQTNYNTLVPSSPRLHWARLKDSSAWRFVANCLLGGYVFHHLSRLTSRFFFSALLWILYSCSFPHLSLLPGCPFVPLCQPPLSTVTWWHLPSQPVA